VANIKLTTADTSGFIPIIWAQRALDVLRNQIVALQFVARDTDFAEPGWRGKAITVGYPGTFTAVDKAADTPVTPQVAGEWIVDHLDAEQAQGRAVPGRGLRRGAGERLADGSLHRTGDDCPGRAGGERRAQPRIPALPAGTVGTSGPMRRRPRCGRSTSSSTRSRAPRRIAS
jgi:hypothetical protein